MAANTKLATAVQILCVIAYKGDGGTNAQIVSRSLRTNPVVVRRLLKTLEMADLVALRPGRDGGVQLKRAPDDITLEQIYCSVEPTTAPFALRTGGNPVCPVDRRMKDLLTPVFDDSETALRNTLRGKTLGSLMRSIEGP